MRTNKSVILLIAALLALAVSPVGCASVPARQKAVVSLQSVQVALGKIQDAEREICNTALYRSLDVLEQWSVAMPVCEGPNAAAARLTTEKHKEISSVLAKAFALNQRAATALLIWQPGSPEPGEVTQLMGQAKSFLSVAQSLAATEQQKALVSLAAALIKEIEDVIDAVKGGH